MVMVMVMVIMLITMMVMMMMMMLPQVEADLSRRIIKHYTHFAKYG